MKDHKRREKERRRNRIYSVATKTLWQKGYDKTTIRDIAKATDMTTAGLYYYFRSKEELLFQILDSHMNDLISGISKISREISDPLTVIRDYINYQVNVYCTDKYRSKLILNDDDCLSGNWYSQIKNKQKTYLMIWRQALKRYYLTQGLPISDIAIDAHCLVGMCNWIYRWYDPGGRIKPDMLAARIFETFVLGISSKGVSTSV